ncbi:hypothetical protein HPU229334_01090 [Helicobacter pullorum]|uniref:Uncharacterized protein n=1 Tax=Helicobacter pullorum TaxID=35818 RepID=A0A0N1MN50_9HELI|nr:hypothetical protein HPU229334_01090 [Helicobacter pullorum]
MLIILFLVAISLVLFFYFKKYMDIVEIFFMFPFIIYAICCLAITFYGYAAGYGERESFDIETTLFFIELITPSLILYTIIKLLIDTFQNFKVWKILNFMFLCVFMCFYLVIFELIGRPVILPNWIVFFISYRIFFIYISAILILYVTIKILIDMIQNFKVWKILNFIFVCVFMYAFFAKLEAIQAGYIFNIPCFDESHKIISCLELANEK